MFKRGTSSDSEGLYFSPNASMDPQLEPLLFIPALMPPPKAASEVPTELANDYNEAYLILELSPQAAAALARRCLQGVLRERGHNQTNLVQQIQAVLPSLPPHIAQVLDAVRHVGNFAAHPMKDTATGQILPVEIHEAETILEVLAQLFDLYYVQTAKNRDFITNLNAKLTAAGKPTMPVPP